MSRMNQIVTRCAKWSAIHPLMIIIAIFVTIALWRAVVFCSFAGLPAFYVKDLGFDFITTEYIRHSLHSLTDFKDMLGWSVWWDQPFFFFNGYESYLATVPLSYLLGTWESIKVLEVLSICAAFSGTFWLMRLFGRRKEWSLFAALTYAATPIVVFAPRGNLDYGIPSVLLPAVLATGVVLIRRIGAWALPFCGLLCGMVGLCAGLEFLVFVSLPAFVVLIAYAYRRPTITIWFTGASIGTIAMVFSGAYYVVPTFFGLPFSDSATRLVALYNEDFAPEFSQGFVELLALVSKETLLSPVLYYNSSGQLTTALVAGVLIWFLAFIGSLRRLEHFRTIAGGTALAVCVVLVFLSAAALLPGGADLWRLFGHVPLLNAIRTPNRFFTFPVLFIVCAAADGLAELVERVPRFRVGSALVSAVIFACLYGFAGAGHVWENQQDYGSVEPDLKRVNEVVAGLDHRTASFALANGESPIDAASYGVPTPTMSNFWEFAARYGSDGVAGTGIFQKAGIRSIVTSPPWGNSDVAGIPDYSNIYRHAPGTLVRFKANSGLTVLELSHPDPSISPVDIRCLEGGPGLIDRLLATESFASIALTRTSTACPRSVLANEDPFSELHSPQARFLTSGARLCASCRLLQDIDDGFDTTRYRLKIPWYRNSIDGDTPAFDSRGAALIDGDADINVPYRDPTGGARFLIIRGAAHAYVTLAVRFPDGTKTSVRLFPGRGLRSLAIPFVSDGRDESGIQIHVDADGADLDDSGFAWTGYGLDGAAVLDARTYNALLYARRESLTIAMDPIRFTALRDDRYHADRFVPSSGSKEVSRYPRAIGRAFVTIPWNGPAGLYAIEARAIGAYAHERLEVAVGGHSCCWTSGPTSESALNAGGVERLTRGSTIFARVVDTVGRRNVRDTISEIVVTRVEGIVPLHVVTLGEEIGNVNFAAGPSSLSLAERADTNSASAFGYSGFSGTAGTRLVFAFQASATSNLSVSFRGLGGPGKAKSTLSCGDRQTSETLTRSVVDALVLLGGAGECHLAIRWSGELSLGRIVIKAFNTKTTFRAWLSQGRYVVNAYTSKLEHVRLSHITIDGQRLGEGQFSVPHSGMHDIALQSVPGNMNLLLFRPNGLRDSLPLLAAKPTASLRYAVKVRRRGTIKINHLNDGNWQLIGNHRTSVGFDCDIIDTCFEGVDPGDYTVMHRWSRPLKIGVALSALSVLLAVSTLIFTLLRFRAKSVSQAVVGSAVR